MIQARPYRSEDKALWDGFVKTSKNGTFLLERDFMEYHQDRFTDCSLTLWDEEDLVALLPANWEETTRTVWSHQGLTYGGLVMSNATTTQQAVEALAEAARYWSDTLGARTLIYKAIPYIYSTQPAQEDLYALSRLNARKKWCLASTAVDIKAPLRIRTLRQRCVKKALEADCYVERVGEGETESLREFWHILEEVLSTRHNLTPVHSVEEMQLLMARFPPARRGARAARSTCSSSTSSRSATRGWIIWTSASAPRITDAGSTRGSSSRKKASADAPYATTSMR